MNLEFGVEFQLGNAPQIFFQDGGFDLELMFVAGVLVVASAAALKVRAPRFDASRRSRNDFLDPGARKTRFLFEQDGFHRLVLEDERNKHSLAAATLVRQASGPSHPRHIQVFQW